MNSNNTPLIVIEIDIFNDNKNENYKKKRLMSFSSILKQRTITMINNLNHVVK